MKEKQYYYYRGVKLPKGVKPEDLRPIDKLAIAANEIPMWIRNGTIYNK